MKLVAFLLTLLASTSALADCKTVADDVVRYDQRLKAEANQFESRDFLRRLDSLIDAMRGDIDGLKWLMAHHCGAAEEEPNAMKSVHDMQLMLIALITRRMDARALR